MNEQLQDMKARLEAATPGPWTTGGSGVVADREYVAQGVRTDPDAEFIAHAPETQAKLIAALQAALATADALIEKNQDSTSLQSWGLMIAGKRVREAIAEALV